MTTPQTSCGRPDPDALAVAQAVYDATRPRQAILFGSRARGAYRPDSDIDIAIITAAPVAADDRPAFDAAAEQAVAVHPAMPRTDVSFLTIEQFLTERVKKNTFDMGWL